MKRPGWQERGTEPDYRFTLANERTFLAWIRTALAVLAGSVLLDQLLLHQPTGVLDGVAITLAVLAAVLAGCGYLRWRGNEIAMRHSAPLPGGAGIPVLTAAIGCLALVLTMTLLAKGQ